MTREHERQLLESITQSFTSEQSAEYARRIRTVDMLLSRVCPKCGELSSEIQKQRKDKREERFALGVALSAVGIWWILKSLSIVTSDSIFYLAVVMFLFLLGRMHFAPEGANAVAVSTLKILTFTTITRIEELGASERSVFMCVREVTGLNASAIREIRECYLPSAHRTEDYESIRDGDDEDDSESSDEGDTSDSWGRICVEVARAVRTA